MSNFWISVLSSIVAQLIDVIFISITSAILIFFITISRRSKLFNFFSLTIKSKPDLDIYLSKIQVVKGGALYSDGSKAVNFEGITVSAGEFLEIPTIDQLFHPKIISYIPMTIRQKLSKWNIAFSDVNKNYKTSPSETSLISGRNIFFRRRSRF